MEHRLFKGLCIGLTISILLWILIICSVSAQELSKSDLLSDSKLLLTTAKLSMSKLDSKSMQFDNTVCSFKSGNLMELKTSANAIKFGFTEPDVITCTNIVECEGHKTWTTEDKWLYWNPVWLMTGYNSGLDEEGKLYMTPSFSNLVSISCTCKKEETRYYDECTMAVYDEKEPDKVKTPESCKTVSYKFCLLYDATIRTPASYDPVYEANSAPLITAISQSTPTNLFYDYENITGSLTVTDTDSTDRIYNYSMFSEASGKNTSLFVPFEQPFPTDVSGNALTLTTSGFTTYDGVLGNATVGDAAEPTIVAGKYGRGIWCDGNDYINNSMVVDAGHEITVLLWYNLTTYQTNQFYRFPSMFTLTTNPANINQFHSYISVNNTLLDFYFGGMTYNKTSFLASTFKDVPSGGDGFHYIYVDGSQKTKDYTNAGNLTINIPQMYCGSNQFAIGMMDSIIVYKCQLSSAQINASMLSPYPLSTADGLPCDPVLSYSFESVSSGYVNDTSMQVSDGHGGGAYKFDGADDYIDVNNAINHTQGNWTLSVVVNRQGGTGSAGIVRLSAGITEFSLYENGGNFRAQVDNATGVEYWTNIAGYKLNVPVFLNIVRFDNSTMLLYINGTRVYSKNQQLKTSSSKIVTIGHLDSFYLNGSIDLVKIDNYALSDSQILLDYTAWLNNRTSNILSSDMTSTSQIWGYCARSGDFALRSAYNCSNPQTILASCYANLVNTTWSYFNSSCKFNASSNYYDYNRSRTTYDSNNCLYFSNVTFWEYNYTVQEGCDYCIPVISHNETGFMTQESCKSYNYIDMNNTLVYYDTLDCYSLTSLVSDQYNLTYEYIYKNQSCLIDATCSVSGFDNLTEEINMLALIVLWLGLWAFGYWALQTRNDLLAGTMIVLTVPVDIYFAYIFQESLNIATGFLGIAFGVMSAWTFGVFVLLRRSVKG